MNLKTVATGLAALCLLAGASLSFAVPEADVVNLDKTTLAPFFEKGEAIDFPGARGLRIRGRAFTGPKSESVIVIVPGWTEPARKYAETIYDLNQLGYSVFVIDHRGQGESSRPINCGFCSYVENYKYYIADLDKFIRTEVRPRGPWKKIVLIAHSMGGGIATATLQLDPTLVDAAILTSPMQQIDTDPYPEAVAQTLIEGAVLAGQGKKRRLFDKNTPDTFENNISTHSVARWTVGHQIGIDHPELEITYATNGWLHQVFDMTDAIRLSPKVLTMPILLMQATDEKYVMNPIHAKLCSKWTNCRLYTVNGAKHSLLDETDPLRNEAFGQMASFLKSINF